MMFKRVFLGVLCIIMSLAAAGCVQKISGTPVRYDNLDELSAVVGFDVIEPAVLPEGYVLAGYFAIEDKVAEVLYMNGDNELIYAMSSVKNIESDIADIDQVKTEEIAGKQFELSYKDGYILLAVTEQDGFTYTIYTQAGLSTGEFNLIAAGIALGDKEAASGLEDPAETEKTETEKTETEKTETETGLQTAPSQDPTEPSDGTETQTEAVPSDQAGV